MAYRKRKKQRRNRSRYRRRGKLTVLVRILSFLIICAAIVAAMILFFKVQTFVVTGNQRYDEQEIVDSTGLVYEDNMFLMNKYAIERQIAKQLPYVRSVHISRKLPDTLLIEVEECKPVAEIIQGGERWLLSADGKLLERVNSSAGYLQIKGVQLLLPTEGSSMEFPLEANISEERLLELIALLEQRGMLKKTQKIDCTDPEELVMAYANRFDVVMTYTDDFGQAMTALEGVISQLQSNETGTILMTDLAVKVNFVPDHR